MRGAVGIVLALLPACSFVAARPPGSVEPGEVPRCNPSKGTVTLDAIIAGGWGVGAMAAASDDAGEAGIALGLLGALYAGSAAYGNSAANKCRRALGAYERVDSRESSVDSSRSWRPTPTPAPAPVLKADLEPEPESEPKPEPEPEPELESGSWPDFWAEVVR